MKGESDMTVENIQSGYGNATVGYTRKTVTTAEKYREIFAQKLSETDEVIRNGSTEKAIQLGGAAYTSEEWDEMIANFDATMDDLREQMRIEHAKNLKQQTEKTADMQVEIKVANAVSGVEKAAVFSTEDMYTEFSTSKYDVVPDDEYDCFHIYNKEGEGVGTFSYSDIVIKTDEVTETQMLISEHGTAAYDALLLDQELIIGFQNSMGVNELPQEMLMGFTVNTHLETGIRYLVKAGDEGRGGRLLFSSDAELAKMDELAETYLRDYPNLVSNKEVAQINAVLEVLGLMQRTPTGIVSVNRDGMSYNDNIDSEKNWALLFEGDYYDTVFEFVKLQRVLGADMSDYKLWDEFFRENDVQIHRIWSDQELEQGYLNN